jgi:hypothetical protein
MIHNAAISQVNPATLSNGGETEIEPSGMKAPIGRSEQATSLYNEHYRTSLLIVL